MAGLNRRAIGALIVSLCCVLAGCANGSVATHNETVEKDDHSAQALDAGSSCKNREFLTLWQRRSSNDTTDFPIGPGDVITLSVPEIDELQKQQVRVSSEGTIGLPLIGTMEVAGLDENDLRTAVSERLATYMKHPRVELFVERYQTREVAVIGAVQKPGLYDLASSDQSIISLIGNAGGMTAEAAQKVIFVPPKYRDESSSGPHTTLPANSGFGTQIKLAANDSSASDGGSQRMDPHDFDQLNAESYAVMKGRSWIALDLTKPTDQACLDLPTRPGDVVMVPIAGQVMVQGWVKNQGAFRIIPGMTVLGAISAAGGATFSWSAELLRPESGSKQTIAKFDLTKLARGEQSDVAVQSGDVVVVERSAVGALPYALLGIFNRFGTGMYFPAI
jgi:polysaccharide export outer membrane protein